jgi:hypothetical protein
MARAKLFISLLSVHSAFIHMMLIVLSDSGSRTGCALFSSSAFHHPAA